MSSKARHMPNVKESLRSLNPARILRNQKGHEHNNEDAAQSRSTSAEAMTTPPPASTSAPVLHTVTTTPPSHGTSRSQSPQPTPAVSPTRPPAQAMGLKGPLPPGAVLMKGPPPPGAKVMPGMPRFLPGGKMPMVRPGPHPMPPANTGPGNMPGGAKMMHGPMPPPGVKMKMIMPPGGAGQVPHGPMMMPGTRPMPPGAKIMLTGPPPPGARLVKLSPSASLARPSTPEKMQQHTASPVPPQAFPPNVKMIHGPPPPGAHLVKMSPSPPQSRPRTPEMRQATSPMPRPATPPAMPLAKFAPTASQPRPGLPEVRPITGGPAPASPAPSPRKIVTSPSTPQPPPQQQQQQRGALVSGSQAKVEEPRSPQTTATQSPTPHAATSAPSQQQQQPRPAGAAAMERSSTTVARSTPVILHLDENVEGGGDEDDIQFRIDTPAHESSGQFNTPAERQGSIDFHEDIIVDNTADNVNNNNNNNNKSKNDKRASNEENRQNKGSISVKDARQQLSRSSSAVYQEQTALPPGTQNTARPHSLASSSVHSSLINKAGAEGEGRASRTTPSRHSSAEAAAHKDTKENQADDAKLTRRRRRRHHHEKEASATSGHSHSRSKSKHRRRRHSSAASGQSASKHEETTHEERRSHHTSQEAAAKEEHGGSSSDAALSLQATEESEPGRKKSVQDTGDDFAPWVTMVDTMPLTSTLRSRIAEQFLSILSPQQYYGVVKKIHRIRPLKTDHSAAKGLRKNSTIYVATKGAMPNALFYPQLRLYVSDGVPAAAGDESHDEAREHHSHHRSNGGGGSSNGQQSEDRRGGPDGTAMLDTPIILYEAAPGNMLFANTELEARRLLEVNKEATSCFVLASAAILFKEPALNVAPIATLQVRWMPYASPASEPRCPIHKKELQLFDPYSKELVCALCASKSTERTDSLVVIPELLSGDSRRRLRETVSRRLDDARREGEMWVGQHQRLDRLRLHQREAVRQQFDLLLAAVEAKRKEYMEACDAEYSYAMSRVAKEVLGVDEQLQLLTAACDHLCSDVLRPLTSMQVATIAESLEVSSDSRSRGGGVAATATAFSRDALRVPAATARVLPNLEGLMTEVNRLSPGVQPGNGGGTGNYTGGYAAQRGARTRSPPLLTARSESPRGRAIRTPSHTDFAPGAATNRAADGEAEGLLSRRAEEDDDRATRSGRRGSVSNTSRPPSRGGVAGRLGRQVTPRPRGGPRRGGDGAAEGGLDQRARSASAAYDPARAAVPARRSRSAYSLSPTRLRGSLREQRRQQSALVTTHSNQDSGLYSNVPCSTGTSLFDYALHDLLASSREASGVGSSGGNGRGGRPRGVRWSFRVEDTGDWVGIGVGVGSTLEAWEGGRQNDFSHLWIVPQSPRPQTFVLRITVHPVVGYAKLTVHDAHGKQLDDGAIPQWNASRPCYPQVTFGGRVGRVLMQNTPHLI